MKKLLKQLLAVTTAIMMAITLLPAMANAEPTINPNDTATGTLTLTKKVPKKDNEIQDTVKGAVFTAYKVATLTPGENGSYSKFELVSPFNTLSLTTDTLGNISTKALEGEAKAARAITEDKNLQSQFIKTGAGQNTWESAATNEKGVTTISNLPKGYYLVVET